MPIAKANGINLYYELTGRGEPFVFISGTGDHGKIWRPYQQPFFSKDYRVLIYDHRGTGESDKPEVEYSSELFADDLAALMDALRLSAAHILGHSMGGRVAQTFALRHPEKVRSLILASTGTGAHKSNMEDLPLDMCVKMIEGGYADYWYKSARSDFYFPPFYKKEHPERVEELAALWTFQMPPIHAYLRHVIARQRHDTTATVKDIKAPCLIIVGEDDNVNHHREQSEDLKKALPHADFALVPRCRHHFLWQEPELSNNLILEFVRRH